MPTETPAVIYPVITLVGFNPRRVQRGADNKPDGYEPHGRYDSILCTKTP